MTNNPDKIAKLTAEGIEVSRRIAHEIEPNSHNRFYLETKARRSGHLLGDSGINRSGENPFARSTEPGFER